MNTRPLPNQMVFDVGTTVTSTWAVLRFGPLSSAYANISDPGDLRQPVGRSSGREEGGRVRRPAGRPVPLSFSSLRYRGPARLDLGT